MSVLVFPQELWQAELRHHAPPPASEEELHIEQARGRRLGPCYRHCKVEFITAIGLSGISMAISYPSQMVEGMKFLVKDARDQKSLVHGEVGLANSAVIVLLKSPSCLALGWQVVYV